MLESRLGGSNTGFQYVDGPFGLEMVQLQPDVWIWEKSSQLVLAHTCSKMFGEEHTQKHVYRFYLR